MTRLHAVDGIEPIGEHMGELAELWCELLVGAPSHEAMTYVTFSPEQGGLITAYFAEPEAVIRWAEHLGGLAFTREHIAGRTWVVVAQGQVTRGDYSAAIRLKANYIDRGAA